MWWWMIGGLATLALMKSDNSNNKIFKLGALHIKKHKMFEKFIIDFSNPDTKKALPIIVIAGKNGTGKTTLLEYLANYTADTKDDYLILTKEINNQIKSSKMAKGEDGIIEIRAEYKKIVKYMKVNVNNVDNIEEYIADYYIDLAKKLDSFSKALTEVQNLIKKSFKDLDLGFNVSDIDYKVKQVLFKKNDSDVEFGIESLSTGEKTLISKVLSLFFEQVKNKIILIDEPELSLHPSWQNRVLKIYENFAKQNNCQIIIATHSPHIIGSAKPEYIRLLKKEGDKIVAIDNIDRSYGLEFDKILTDIMGVENLRTPAVAKDIKRLWDLLADEDYESDEYITLYNQLEELLGSLDKDMVLSRLEIARIKSQNVKSK